MQPLMYLAARTLIGWLSFMERKEHALKRDARIMVAVGALHCWAVAYALFIAVHTRAMRYDGYQEFAFGEYTDHLPTSVAIAEKLTLGSIWLWLLATFVSAVKSVMEDETTDLPLDCREQSGTLTKFLSSPSMSSMLALANTGACAGLFVGILLLCVSMAIMAGGITACEVSLAMLSFAFALPHAVVALQRVVPELGLTSMLPPDSVQAAAGEATVLAPQLCVMLSLADSPGHAHTWQNCVYVAASLATLWAMFACAATPRVREGCAMPPEESETFVCFIANAMSAIVLVLSYPELNTWFVWLAIIAFVVGTTAGYSFWREFALDWLEQALVLRGDADKRVPCAGRDSARRCAWLATLLCGAAAVWDIATVPPVTDQAAVEPDYLLMRWKGDQGKEPKKLLADVAGELRLDSKALVMDHADQDHRLMIFRHVPTGPMGRGELPVPDRWKDMASSLPAALAGRVESGFPHLLNISVCYDETIFPPPPGENETAPPRTDDHRFGHSSGAHAAYEVACGWRALQISRYLQQLRLLQHRMNSDPTEYTVRWKPREPAVTGQEMLSLVAPALGVEVGALTLKQEFAAYRLAVFAHKPASVELAATVPGKWRALLAAPADGLKEVLDPTFPAELNFTMCSDESVFPVPPDGQNLPESQMDDSKFGGEQGAFVAYLTLCHWRIHQILHASETLKKLQDGGGKEGAAAAAAADDMAAVEGADLA